MTSLQTTPQKVKPMRGLSRVRNGQLMRETHALSEQQARSFARCIESNRRYTEVELKHYASTDGWKVFWLPANPERQAEMLDREKDKRAARAAEEGAAYEFHQDTDNRSLWWVIPVSGEPYELSFNGSAFVSCTCSDFHYRGAALGPCKHLIEGNARKPWIVDVKCSMCDGAGVDNDYGTGETCFGCGGSGVRRMAQ